MRRSSRRRRPYGTILGLLLLAVALVWVLIPMWQGKPIPGPLAFLEGLVSREALAADSSRPALPKEGKLRVFTSGRVIPAYTKLTRDDLWNAKAGTWAYADVDESAVGDSGVLVEFRDIVGRVLSREKPAGYVFTENDFLPKGTRPGLAAGVPIGKRALRIDVDMVHGIVGLRPGDRFDMVAAVELDSNANAASASFGGIYANQMAREQKTSTYKRARVQVLVQNGVVVSPLETRLVPITSSSLTSGQSTRTIPKQEMVIALDPEEVAPFMEALSVKAQLTCLARSGLPDDPLDSVTPSSDPTLSLWSPQGTSTPGAAGGGMSVVESIDESSRTLIPVPLHEGVDR